MRLNLLYARRVRASTVPDRACVCGSHGEELERPRGQASTGVSERTPHFVCIAMIVVEWEPARIHHELRQAQVRGWI